MGVLQDSGLTGMKARRYWERACISSRIHLRCHDDLSLNPSLLR